MNLVDWSVLQRCLSLGRFYQTLPGEDNNKTFIVAIESGLYAWIELLSDSSDSLGKPRVWVDFLKSGDDISRTHDSLLYLDIRCDANGGVEKALFSPEFRLRSDLIELIKNQFNIADGNVSAF